MKKNETGPSPKQEKEKEGNGPKSRYNDGMQELAGMIGVENVTAELLAGALLNKMQDRISAMERPFNDETLEISDIKYEDERASLWLHYESATQHYMWKATCRFHKIRQMVQGEMKEVVSPSWDVINRSNLEAAIRKQKKKN
jgi:hypothetical protein